ncbi:MAG: tRNA lysidine(34) synthetase TilS [Candidatus Cloacimonadota bacterium]|nr:MAG: tRNA lysidine(34) synthetase TilS [Candidatus Cloacimonadota bacterium]PIE78786.1 MAG: tRNA lysidine(34) synthetase TilS [Candidatus Delongbacteria bacterium]
MENIIFIEAFKELIPPKSDILVALSGGPDSIISLYFCNFLKKDGYISKLEAIHINHNLRGDESNSDQKFCEDYCKSLNIPLTVKSIRLNGDKDSKGLENLARDFRYREIENYDKEFKSNFIILGHHKNDKVETTLFNIFRGTALKGISSIRSKRGKYIRPLLKFEKREIVDYLNSNGIPFIVDSSNNENDYSRNKIRNIIIPTIERSLNRRIVDSVYRVSKIAEECEEFVKEYIVKLMNKEGFKRGYNTTIILNRDLYLKEKPYIQKEIISYIYRDYFKTYSPPFLDINEIVKSLKTYSKPFNSNKIFFEASKNSIIITPVDKNITLNNDPYSFKGSVNSWNLLSSSSSVLKFDLDKVVGRLKVEPIDKNRSFQPFGKSKEIKVSKILSDKKIPLSLRKKLFVLSDGENIVYIPHCGTNRRYKTDDNTTKTLYIEENGVVNNLFIT